MPPAKAVVLPPIPLNPKEEQSLIGLSITEKCLIVQAVYETGTSDFKAASKLLQSHPLLKHRAKSYFNGDRMALIHTALTKEMGFPTEEPLVSNSPQLLQVARKWYLERVFELRAVMQTEVDNFKKTFQELELLKSGESDWRLTDPERVAREEASRQRPRPSPPPPELPQTPQALPSTSPTLTSASKTTSKPIVEVIIPMKGNKKRKSMKEEKKKKNGPEMKNPVEQIEGTDAVTTSTAPPDPSNEIEIDKAEEGSTITMNIEGGVAAAVAAALEASEADPNLAKAPDTVEEPSRESSAAQEDIVMAE